MRKVDLARKIAKDSGITIKEAQTVIDSVFNNIKAALVEGDSYTVDKMFTLKLKDRPARKGHNPLTGEAIEIPASKALKVSVSAALKNELKALAQS